MASWNVLATSLEGRRDALLMALRRLGKFRRGGYRNVVVGAVESVDEFLARVREALDADPLLPTALAKVVPIEATVRIEAPTAVETLAAAAEPFIDRLAGGSFFVPSRFPPSRACPTRGSPITLITDGFPAANARSSAGRISSGRVTCSPWQPIASNMRS